MFKVVTFLAFRKSLPAESPHDVTTHDVEVVDHQSVAHYRTPNSWRVARRRRRMIDVVGARPCGQTSVQLPWPWQRASASSESRTDQRAAAPASRRSRWSVKARFSAAGPGNRGLWATIVHADTHMPQPMHSIAGSISRR